MCSAATRQIVGRPGLLRDINTKAVFEHVAESGGASRSAIADILGLSATSVSRITDSLLRARLLREGKQLASRVGRRQTLLQVEPSAGVVVAIIVRTRSIRVSATDLSGKRISNHRVPMVATNTLDLVNSLVHEVETTSAKARWSLITVALGLPGAWDHRRKRVYSIPNLPFLEGTELFEALEARLNVPVEIDNDVNFAALGEYHFGAAKGVDNLLYLNLGSGIGGGIVVGGKLHRGGSGFAGEVGNLPIRNPDGDGYVPLESIASRSVLDQKLALAGIDGGVVQWLSQLEPGVDNDNHGIVRLLADRCSLAIAMSMCLMDPELVVLGGSIGRYGGILVPLVSERLEGLIGRGPEIATTLLREDAALLGAAAVGLAASRRLLVEQLIA